MSVGLRMLETAKFEHEPEEQRFVLTVGGEACVIEYTAVSATTWSLYHSEVPPHLRGRGIGGELTRRTLAYLKERGIRVRPSCSFIGAYIRDHPEFAPMVAR